MKILKTLTMISLLGLASLMNAHAHVVVKPSQVNAGKFENFTMSVPVEKDQPTTELRLEIPESLENIRPNVKPGWTITFKRDGDTPTGKVKEIIWEGGAIPAGLRDEFIFSAKVPVSEGTLQWKAYQKYQDGTVVSWNAAPKAENNEDSSSVPYSETQIIDDLKDTTQKKNIFSKENLTLLSSLLALVISCITLINTRYNKEH